MPYERIKMNPDIMDGKLVVRGTRVPVELALRKLGAGMSPEAIRVDHPRLKISTPRKGAKCAACSADKHRRNTLRYSALRARGLSVSDRIESESFIKDELGGGDLKIEPITFDSSVINEECSNGHGRDVEMLGDFLLVLHGVVACEHIIHSFERTQKFGRE